MHFAGGDLQTKQVQRFNIPAKEQGTPQAVVPAHLRSWKSPRAPARLCQPHSPGWANTAHHHPVEGVSNCSTNCKLQNCKDYEDRIFITILLPLSYLFPVDPCAQRGWREMGSTDLEVLLQWSLVNLHCS